MVKTVVPKFGDMLGGAYIKVANTKKVYLTLIRWGWGPNVPSGFKNLISLEPKVGLTKNQAANLIISVVY